jgi:type I restriction enzyme, S subunit
MVPANTILMVVRGMILAHTLPVGLTTREMTFNQDIKAIVCNDGVIPVYLAYWLTTNSGALLKLITESTHGTKRFDMGELLKVNFALPQYPEEQQRILDAIFAQDKCISIEKTKLDKLKQLKQGLMNDLLSGRVRLKQV